MASNSRYQIHMGRNELIANYAYDLAGNCVWFFCLFWSSRVAHSNVSDWQSKTLCRIP